MIGLKTLKDHETLMTRMAQTLGTDLDEAELRGDLPPPMRDDMQSACVGCSEPGKCKRFLATHAVAEAAPDYCRNGTVLMALRTA